MYLVPFVLLFFSYFSFLGVKVILFWMWVGWGFIFCWSEFDIHFYFRGLYQFWGRVQGSGCKEKSCFIIVYIPIIFFINYLEFLNVLHNCTCTCVSLCTFVCAQMCGCTGVCELWYLNISVRDLQVMRAHIFLNFLFLVIWEKGELYILSLKSVTSIKKPVNLLKVVYHPVSCLLHHYIDKWFS